MASTPSEKKDEERVKRVSRRDFLLTGGAAAAVGGAGLLLGPRILGNHTVKAASGTGKKYTMVIDLQRCTGCRACMQACKVENNTPQGIIWMYVFRLEEGIYPNVTRKYIPRPCMHCNNAPCVKVCPVGARYKREDGLTAMDRDRCIGCRYCQVSCPYSVNYFQWKDPRKNQYYDWNGTEGDHVRNITGGTSPPYRNPSLEAKYGQEQRHIAGSGLVKGVMEKCTFCVHRIERGLLPACVANCPVKTYTFGDRNDPDSAVSKLLAEKSWFRLAEEHGTEPSVYYIGGSPPGEDVRELDPIKGVA